LHCFCPVPEGLEGHGCIYLCSVDCQHSSVVQTPTCIPNTLVVTVGGVVVTVGGEHYRSPIGCNHYDIPEIPNLSPILDQPSSPSHSLPPLYNNAGDDNFIGVDNAVVNESMANLDQVHHPPDVDDGSADSCASAPDEAVDAALVNINLDVNFAHTLIKNNPVMKVKLKAQKRNVLTDEAYQEASQHIADYIEQLCNLPYCFNQDGHWFSTCTYLKCFDVDDTFLYSVSTMLCKYF
jgi:hypothetical protein